MPCHTPPQPICVLRLTIETGVYRRAGEVVSPAFADLLRVLDDTDCEVIVVQAQGSE